MASTFVSCRRQYEWPVAANVTICSGNYVKINAKSGRAERDLTDQIVDPAPAGRTFWHRRDRADEGTGADEIRSTGADPMRCCDCFPVHHEIRPTLHHVMVPRTK